jgi:hypothetical protein
LKVFENRVLRRRRKEGRRKWWEAEEYCIMRSFITCTFQQIRGCIQKFPDWPPGARTANGTALCH